MRPISIDIETYGAVEGKDQTLFHPMRCLYTDQIPLDQLIKTVSITIPEYTPWNCPPSIATDAPSSSISRYLSTASVPSVRTLAGLRPGESMTLVMKAPEHREILRSSLRQADTLLGHNIPFDLLFLRTQPDLRPLLGGHHTLIDGMVLNNVHWESRPEKSLKDIGVVRRLYRYKRSGTLKDGHKFIDEWDENLHFYNASDSHNTILEIADFARAILRDWPDTPKTSPFCIEFYSDAMWFAIRLAEAGIPMSRVMLERLHAKCLTTTAEALITLKQDYGLVIGGEGSDESKRKFLDAALALLDNSPIPARLGLKSVLDHKMVELTKKRRQLSLGDQNRAFISLLLKDIPCPTPNASSSGSSESSLEQPSLPSEHMGTLPSKKCGQNPISSPLNSKLVAPLLCSSASALASPASAGSSSIMTTERIQQAFKLWNQYAAASKTLSSYTRTLLVEKTGAKVKNPLEAAIIPQPGCPKWIENLPGFVRLQPQPPKEKSCPKSNVVGSRSSGKTGLGLKKLSTSTPDPAQLSLFPTTSSTTTDIAEPSPPTTSEVPSSRELKSCRATGQRWDTWLAYPTIYVVPGPTKDTSGDSGGQKQARFSIKNPAFQTFSREVMDCQGSRWGDEGCLVSFDLSQIELCVPALISGEPSLVDAFNNKWDLHGRTAETLFGTATLTAKYPELLHHPLDKWRKVCEAFSEYEGQLGKTINFAEAYWAQAKRMQATCLKDLGLLLPIEFFYEVVQSRPLRRPVLYAWQEAHLWEVTKKGYSIVPFTGQSRNFEGYDYSYRKNRIFLEDKKDETSEVLNHPIQTLAANVTHRISAKLHKILPALNHPDPPCFAYGNVYDAIKFDCKKSFRKELEEGIRTAIDFVEKKEYWSWLIEHYGHSVPLGFEIKCSGS